MKTFNTVAIETEIHGVDSNEELNVLFAKALQLCQTTKNSQETSSSSSKTQYLSSQNVTYCIYNAANVDLQPVPLLESAHSAYSQANQENKVKRDSSLGDGNDSRQSDEEVTRDLNCDNRGKPKCFVCDKQYVHQEDLSIHIKSHEVDIQGQSKITKHNKGLHAIEQSAENEDPDIFQEAQTTESVESGVQNMLQQESRNQKHDESQKLKENQSKKEEKMTYVCNHCEKVFTRKSTYKKHIRTHTIPPNQQFVCSYCNKVFPWISALQVHLRTHTKETPFPCQHCEKAFAIASALKDHVARRHLGDKPHKCSICEKSFVKRWELTEHQRVHTGERPFKCQYCDKTFLRKPHLTVHLKIHTGERPHKCEFCDKGFVRKRDLVEHSRTHTGERPHKCDLCDKAFLRKTHLIQHLKTHTGGRPYKCDHCVERFAKAGDLQQHLQTHTQE